MAAVAVIVIDPSPGGLLLVQAEFGIALPPLNVTPHQTRYQNYRNNHVENEFPTEDFRSQNPNLPFSKPKHNNRSTMIEETSAAIPAALVAIIVGC
jgi:hypothetical protein